MPTQQPRFDRHQGLIWLILFRLDLHAPRGAPLPVVIYTVVITGSKHGDTALELLTEHWRRRHLQKPRHSTTTAAIGYPPGGYGPFREEVCETTISIATETIDITLIVRVSRREALIWTSVLCPTLGGFLPRGYYAKRAHPR